MMYDEGVKLGDGTEEEREKARRFIQLFGMYHGQLARAQCSLSNVAVFETYEEYGHDIPIRNPAVVAEQVRKFLTRLAKV